MNKATVLLRLGILRDDPDAIAKAIGLEHGLLSDMADTSRGQMLLSNLGDAYVALARYRDPVTNLAEARSEFERSLAAAPDDAGPVVTAELIAKIGYVDLASERVGTSGAGARGVSSLVCARSLFRSAGLTRQADDIDAGLTDAKRDLKTTAYDAGLRMKAPFRGQCRE